MMNFRNILLLAFFMQIASTLNCQETRIDSTILNLDTATIDGIHYKAIFKTDDYFYILDSKEEIVFKSNRYCRFFEFIDFNDDGRKDLIFNYIGNNPNQELIMYDIEDRVFTPVKDFSEYPEPTKIKGTKYYYSYRRSGCADLNWDSDLFYIQNFKAIALGSISGRECNNEEVNDGIYIYKLKENKKTLYKILKINAIHNFEDDKWGFIKDFWTNNYMDFE